MHKFTIHRLFIMLSFPPLFSDEFLSGASLEEKFKTTLNLG